MRDRHPRYTGLFAIAMLCAACASSGASAISSPTLGPADCASTDVLWQRSFASLTELRSKLPGVHQQPELSETAPTIIVVYEHALPIGVAGGPNGSGPLQPTSAPEHRVVCLGQGGPPNYYVDVDVPDAAP